MAIKSTIEKALKLFEIGEDEYIVVTGAVLELLGLRQTDDIDILVSENTFERIKNNKNLKRVDEFLLNGEVDGKVVDVFIHWEPDGKATDLIFENLTGQTEIVNGIRCMNMEKILEWKKTKRRPKDLPDIELIENYFKESRH